LPERRVVITGMGVISPIGLNKEEFWSSLLAGCSGIKEIDRFPTDNFPTKIAAQVKDFQIVDYVSRRDARRMDLFVQFACAAARIAVEDAALTINDENRTRTGVWIASGIGGIGTLESQHHAFMKKGVNGISPFFIPMMIPNMAAGQVSIMLGAMGPNGCTVTACASASHSIGEAFQAIRDNVPSEKNALLLPPLHLLFPNDFYQDPFFSLPVEFSVKDLFPGAKIQFAIAYCHYYFPAHNGSF
jgi:3-oxoacyl-[acyl-carrier-protein] synthase II